MKDKEKYRKVLIACVSIIFMISIAGYINYKYNPEREKDLGQTVYVSTNNDEVDIYKDKQIEKVESLASFRYDRDNMFSELSSNYSSIINNSNSNEEQIIEYQKKLSSLVEEKNQIQMIENLIKNKGIEDVVIIPNTSGKYSVILKSENVSDEIAIQIMQIMIDQLGIEASDISIENVSK